MDTSENVDEPTEKSSDILTDNLNDHSESLKDISPEENEESDQDDTEDESPPFEPIDDITPKTFESILKQNLLLTNETSNSTSNEVASSNDIKSDNGAVEDEDTDGFEMSSKCSSMQETNTNIEEVIEEVQAMLSRTENLIQEKSNHSEVYEHTPEEQKFIDLKNHSNENIKESTDCPKYAELTKVFNKSEDTSTPQEFVVLTPDGPTKILGKAIVVDEDMVNNGFIQLTGDTNNEVAKPSHTNVKSTHFTELSASYTTQNSDTPQQQPLIATQAPTTIRDSEDSQNSLIEDTKTSEIENSTAFKQETKESPNIKSRYGRAHKPKVVEDFYSMNELLDVKKKAKMVKSAVLPKSPVKKAKGTPQKILKKSSMMIAHVTGEDEIEAEIAYMAEEVNIQCREFRSPENIRERKFFKSPAGRAKLENMTKWYIQNSEHGLNDSVRPFSSQEIEAKLPIDVTKVLKIVTNNPENATSDATNKLNLKSSLKTYSNRKKSYQKAEGIESFGLPDDPIVPFEETMIIERNEGIDVDSCKLESVNIDSSLFHLPWMDNPEENNVVRPQNTSYEENDASEDLDEDEEDTYDDELDLLEPDGDFDDSDVQSSQNNQNANRSKLNSNVVEEKIFKKRGRKKGVSPWKKSLTPPTKQSSLQSSTTTPKKRGRPPKLSLDSAGLKELQKTNKRGRKAKSLSPSKVVIINRTNNNLQSGIDLPTKTTGRLGRKPRGYWNDSLTSETDEILESNVDDLPLIHKADITTESSVKRRGRPKKVKQNSMESTPKVTEKDKIHIKLFESETPNKSPGRRGRKPKVTTIEDDLKIIKEAQNRVSPIVKTNRTFNRSRLTDVQNKKTTGIDASLQKDESNKSIRSSAEGGECLPSPLKKRGRPKKVIKENNFLPTTKNEGKNLENGVVTVNTALDFALIESEESLKGSPLKKSRKQDNVLENEVLGATEMLAEKSPIKRNRRIGFSKLNYKEEKHDLEEQIKSNMLDKNTEEKRIVKRGRPSKYASIISNAEPSVSATKSKNTNTHTKDKESKFEGTEISQTKLPRKTRQSSPTKPLTKVQVDEIIESKDEETKSLDTKPVRKTRQSSPTKPLNKIKIGEKLESKGEEIKNEETKTLDTKPVRKTRQSSPTKPLNTIKIGEKIESKDEEIKNEETGILDTKLVRKTRQSSPTKPLNEIKIAEKTESKDEEFKNEETGTSDRKLAKKTRQSSPTKPLTKIEIKERIELKDEQNRIELTDITHIKPTKKTRQSSPTKGQIREEIETKGDKIEETQILHTKRIRKSKQFPLNEVATTSQYSVKVKNDNRSDHKNAKTETSPSKHNVRKRNSPSDQIIASNINESDNLNINEDQMPQNKNKKSNLSLVQFSNVDEELLFKKSIKKEKLESEDIQVLAGVNVESEGTGDIVVKTEPLSYSEEMSLGSIETVIKEEDPLDVGDIIWAKVGYHPYWPAIVCVDPLTNVHKTIKYVHQGIRYIYHVRFFGDNGKRSNISKRWCIKYQSKDDLIILRAIKKEKSRKSIFKKDSNDPFKVPKSCLTKWNDAVAEAEFLKNKTLGEKLDHFEIYESKIPKATAVPNISDKTLMAVGKKITKKIKMKNKFQEKFGLKKKVQWHNDEVLLATIEGPAKKAKPVGILKNSKRKEEAPVDLKTAALENEDLKELEDVVLESSPLKKIRKTFDQNILTPRKIVVNLDTVGETSGTPLLKTSSGRTRKTPQKFSEENFSQKKIKATDEYISLDSVEIKKEIIDATDDLPLSELLKIQEPLGKKTRSWANVSKIEETESASADKVEIVEVGIVSKSESVISDSSSDSAVTTNKKNENLKNLEDFYTMEKQISLFKRNNLFRGVSKEKVCQVCEKPNQVFKCKGRCNGSYHYDCANKLLDVQSEGSETSNDVNSLDSGSSSNSSKNEKEALQTEESGEKDNIEENADLNDSNKENQDEKDSKANTEESKPKKLSLGEQIDLKMEEIMRQIEKENMYEDTSSEYSSYHENYDMEPLNEKDTTTADAVSASAANQSHLRCKNCIEDVDPPCSVCHKAVSKKGSIIRQNCQTPQCGKYYHPECLKYWPQTQWSVTGMMKHKESNEKLNTFICPMHFCHICISDDPRAAISRTASDKLVKCLRCPATYHAQSYCIPAGSEIISTGQILCPRHVTKQKKGKYNVLRTMNTVWCFICSKGGDIVCCETCPTSVHAACLSINLTEDDKFICEDCETGRLPLYDEIVWVKMGRYRWWPALILFPNEVPANINNLPHETGEFVVKFFGTNDHCWISRGRVFLYQEGDMGHISHIKKKVDEVFNRALKEAAVAHKVKQEFKSRKEAEIRNGVKPPPYIRIKANKPVGHVRQFDGNISNTTSCECDPTQENPCGPDSNCLNRLLLTECEAEVCPAGKNCQNQNFEKRIYPPLVPYKTSGRGWGLKTLADIKKSQFVIEYVGEMIDEHEYQRRVKKMNEQKEENYYFLTIDNNRMIDAGPKGNVARFMNHSCQPNCETQKWTVKGDTRIGLFALCDIPASSELTFNYNLECIGKEKKICRCEAPNCSGYIGLKSKPGEPPKKPKKLLKKHKMKKKRLSAASEAVVVNSDPCFVCGETGEVNACQNKICTKMYHLKCVNLDTWPDGKWVCPWHNCNICTKRTIRCCVKCTSSYCPVHSEGNVRYDKLLGFVCSEHDPIKVNTTIEVQKSPEVVRNEANLRTNETDVTSTTVDEVDNLQKKEEFASSNNDDPIEELILTTEDTVTSTPIKQIDLPSKGMDTLVSQNESQEHSETTTTEKKRKKNKKSLPQNKRPKLSLNREVDSQNFESHNVPQKEIILSSTVPTRHLRATRNSTGESPSEPRLLRSRGYESDLPIRKRSILMSESDV